MAQTFTLGDGAVLSYEEYGSGPEYVLSGQMLFGTAPSYETMLADAGAHVFAVTLRGYRPSSEVPEDLGLGWLDQWADDIAEFATGQGIDRFLYTGASHGAGVGWYLARRHRDRLKGLVAIVGAPHDREHDTRSSRARRAMAEAWPDRERFTRVYEEQVFGTSLHPERADLRARRIAENVDHSLGMSEAERRINQGKPWPDAVTDAQLAEELRRIDVPVLLVNTMQDPIISPEAALRAAVSVPFAKAVLWNDENHGVQEEAPERLVPETMLFIEELNAPAGSLAGTLESVPGVTRTYTLRDGATLSYVEYGSGDEVFISGQMLFPEAPSFHSMLPAAPVGGRFLAVTLRGYSPSSTVTEEQGLAWLDRWSDDIAELARGLGIERFVYAGASHGAGVGWYLAQKHPELLKGFVGIVAGPHDRGQDPTSSVVRRSLVDAWPDRDAIRALYTELCFGPLLHPERAQVRSRRLDEYVEHYVSLRPEEARINQGKPWPQAVTDEQLAEQLRSIRVPVLLLSGMQDVIISPRASLRAVREVPGAKAVFWQAEGHCMEEEYPEQLVREVQIWLRELNRPPDRQAPPPAPLAVSSTAAAPTSPTSEEEIRR